MAEIWDAYDRTLNRLDHIHLIRGEQIPNNMYHLVCEIVVQHRDGSYLLMQRDHRKHLGGMWELTAGGSALAGETPLACALRELREETGIVTDGLTELCRIVHDEHHSIYVEFLCITDQDKSNVSLQAGETIAFQWVDRESLLRMEKDQLASSRALTIVQDTDIIGKKVHVIVDRPAGSYHPRNHEIFYPINYGYIEDIIAGDGSGQDVYIIGQDNPLETFDGIVIAVYHRTNDVEDKWIVAEEGTDFSDEEIMKKTHFVEQFFEGYLCR